LRRLGGDRRRGYFAADFADAWARYVPPLGGAVPTVTTVPASPDDPASFWDPEAAA
jgi:hypothetical protein